MPASKTTAANRQTRLRWSTLGFLFAVLLSLAGCTSDFTRPNYETIYRGMDTQQVLKRLGAPDAMQQDRWIYRRDRPFRQAVIHFEQDRVVRKQWFLEPPESSD